MTSEIPVSIVPEIEKIAGLKLTNFVSARGGCINHGGICVTSSGSIFLKWNDRKKFPEMLKVEAKGLSLLRTGTPLRLPKVVHVGEVDDLQFLLLENVSEGRPKKTYWETFGRGLATLHQNTSETFGLDHDNYIGSLRQTNMPSQTWLDFFVEQRLRKQLQMAFDSRKIENGLIKKFESLFARLDSLLSKEGPSLLHGDLWGGNIMTDDVGDPVLIDPAVYYGHREADLAMTQLFGGFDISFLKSYDDAFPLSPGFKDRFDIFNLYPLLVHVNLFGAGYLRQVTSIVDKFA